MVYSECIEKAGYIPEGTLKQQIEQDYLSGTQTTENRVITPFENMILRKVKSCDEDYQIQYGKSLDHEGLYMLSVCANNRETAEFVIQKLMHDFGFEEDTLIISG